jgi:hypothetical protein
LLLHFELAKKVWSCIFDSQKQVWFCIWKKKK